MNIEQLLSQHISEAFNRVFNMTVAPETIALQPTRKEFEGDLTLVTFPYTRVTKFSPEETGTRLGEFLKTEYSTFVANFNVVKGFLNIVISPKVWLNLLGEISRNEHYGLADSNNRKVMVEYSSPNTNKPLHLGHLRNNFLGHSVARILQAHGYDVMKVNLVNDRGIHICKSMLAYKKFGQGETPESAGKKGDKLIGDYYVRFEQENKKYAEELLKAYQREKPEAAFDELAEKAKMNTELMQEAQEMLRQWEKGDPETVALWEKMNGWVYQGFDVTYKLMGVEFDKFYYESNTYLLGKEVVEEGLAKDVFFRKPDGSVWVDLTSDGLDEKLLLRGDGTSVYITQDMGTADLKYNDFPMEKSIYVVGNEQDYHFKVLQLILKKLGRPYAEGIYHLSYGMVELPSGKMKSREGKVVDADDLIQEMIEIAQARTMQLGKIDEFTEDEKQHLFKILALGALKYYLLKVDPKKKMLFNPEESIDFQGDTGVYIQYTYAKTSAIVRRAELLGMSYDFNTYQHIAGLTPVELEVIQALSMFPKRIKDGADGYSPSSIAAYVYELSKIYNKFYVDLSIFNVADAETKAFRIALSAETGKVIKLALDLLGIEAPTRM